MRYTSPGAVGVLRKFRSGGKKRSSLGMIMSTRLRCTTLGCRGIWLLACGSELTFHDELVLARWVMEVILLVFAGLARLRLREASWRGEVLPRA